MKVLPIYQAETASGLLMIVINYVDPPFPEIDIIGAMVIVWSARGKIIRFVVCSIVCNNCAQCNAQCTHI